MAQIPGRPTQVGSALQTQSLTIAETPHSHHIKLPACSICSHRLGKNVRKRTPPRLEPGARVSVHALESGWVDLYPTHGLMPSDGHITLAGGRDHDNVRPAKGILIGGQHHNMDVLVDVVPAVGSQIDWASMRPRWRVSTMHELRNWVNCRSLEKARYFFAAAS